MSTSNTWPGLGQLAPYLHDRWRPRRRVPAPGRLVPTRLAPAGAGICRRALDVALASGSLLLALPIMLLVAAWVRLDSAEPALYR